jgi:hypothetical protein
MPAPAWGRCRLPSDGARGAEVRRPLGLAVVGGLLGSQTLTLYETPVFYTGMEAISVRLRSGALFPDSREIHDYFNRLFHVLRRDPL